MSSLLIKLRSKPHTHNGHLYPVGAVIRIPDDVALAKIKRGEADIASPKDAIKDRDARKKREEAAADAAAADAKKAFVDAKKTADDAEKKAGRKKG